MLTTATTTWGLSSTQFLIGYGVLCVAAVAWVCWQWRETIGRGFPGAEPLPDLGVYELALLTGGRQLAITSALTRLHGDHVLRVRRREGTLKVAGELGPGADPVEAGGIRGRTPRAGHQHHGAAQRTAAGRHVRVDV